ncbi:MAG: hypothetical protein COY81_01165 [Candidatus Pacebacteria bacterium CG_4_10_14_0_8_um_filter_43_12]|nr:MAG: hypothetical protein COY81_01165 [Candidatus Pacebacteria bacterium CG_4_10_14_0_8_um_filter_43_12]
MKKKQLMLVAGGIIILALLAGGLWYAFGQKSTEEQAQTNNKKRVVEPENVISVAERPVIYLTPEADGHNISISIESIKKPATEAEYTMEYQTGTLVQAQENVIQLAELPVKETVFLGTCSAGGKCTYHEDIPGGSLKTRFSGGTDSYVLKSDWKYIDNSTKETAFSSKDAKFQIDSADLKTQRYLIIFNGPGYPEGLTGKVVSDPYILQGSSKLTGIADLTIRATEEGELAIMGWDGSSWQDFGGTVEGKNVTATVDLLPLYIVVIK